MERLTELEAINRMLLGIRLAPVTEVDERGESALAQTILRQTALDIMIPGWNFNTHRLSLAPDANAKVWAPAGTIDIFVPEGGDPVRISSAGNLVLCEDDSEEFTEEVDAFVVKGYDFAELPAPLQMYVLHKARLNFKHEMKSQAGAGDRDIEIDIANARASTRAWDLRQKRQSMLGSAEAQKLMYRRVIMS